ncbi:electron transfer flavoprotein alpha subunit apoprotein [Schinkia azotoformans MEV2011]|uniref:Electron transfer flavoprotein alpha subunit apoprotein n=1 Tax=Schinkia azotoformans MEV2011 TaxID=1348973 RepID=A0A072NKN7_SCHAZ|nr:FAD-binding protein [Schinkia azotoformans]KEF37832.1 electron transfer flavoprotein alpha subunit apoprotein [Schinkia azotoformans MEV2011]MEC1696514.1 FAD-binding protein [Schinkia azotoformans]MEC1716107.1 FAD-binding protein [Schinkia azotoformans]MEC1725995.1 FAD-binding protein [Schinkia azotoformans]MEC1740578.1 FAD-binding protein [Schinkia azotoformans]
MTVKKVWIITDDQNTIGELCGGGRKLGEHVTAVLFGDQAVADEAAYLGADQVYLFEQNGNAMIEANSQPIVELLREEKPNLVMVYSSTRGKLLAGKIASQLGTSTLSNISEFAAEDGSIVVKHMVYGGAAIRTEKALSETVIATTGTGVFEAMPKDESRQVNVIKLEAKAEQSGIRVLETRPKQGEVVNLSAAKRVVGVGRGFASKDDIKMAEELASLVGAEMACSRPIAEGEKWMSKERYIGVSGVVLKPDIYLSIGISGQIQHMVGVNQAKTLVAINKDKNAPVFKQVDIGLVADIYKVLPQIIEKLKA